MAATFHPLPKAAIGLAAAGAMALTASPAAARDRYHHRDDDGISAGEIIAGAVVIGGLAALLSSKRDRYDYDDRYRDRYDGRYGYDQRRYGGSRAAVNRCVRAVERNSRRYGRTDVTQITDVDRKKGGYRVKGRVVVRDGYNGRWGRNGYYDRGKFKCDVRYGRVQDIDFSGLR